MCYHYLLSCSSLGKLGPEPGNIKFYLEFNSTVTVVDGPVTTIDGPVTTIDGLVTVQTNF